VQAKADGWLASLLEAGRVDLSAALDSSQPLEAETVGGYPLRVCVLTPESTAPLPAQPAVAREWPESAVEPLYRPLLLAEPEIEDPDPADLPRPWRAAGDSLHPPAEAVGRLVHHAIQRWLFPGSPDLKRVLETVALEAGLGDSVQRAEAVRLAEMLLARMQNHPLWQEIDMAEARYHEVPYTHFGANRRLDTGYLDLLYHSANGWQILDFKTDSLRSAQERDAALERHRPQMRRYAQAAQYLLRQPVRVRLCFLDDHGLVSLVEVT
jgi:ATP-dependent exoDNAse (exonuclease V) beta subunit